MIHRFQKGKLCNIPSSVMEDRNLTWEAKGILTYILSQRDDWKFTAKELAHKSKNGERRTFKALKELMIAGYVVREFRHNRGLRNGVDYYVCDCGDFPMGLSV